MGTRASDIQEQRPSMTTTPRLSVTESGTWDDQYLPTHAGSRTMGLLMRRTLDNQKSKLTKNTTQERFSKAQVAYEGNLVKQGSFWRTWRKRWFILRSDRPLLCYYKSKSDLELLGELVIDQSTTVDIVQGSPGQFCIKTSSRKLMLSAQDEGGVPCMKKWISLLENTIRQCQTVEPFPFKCIDDTIHLEIDQVKTVLSSTPSTSSPILIKRMKSTSDEGSTVRRTNSLQEMLASERDTRNSRHGSSKLLTAMAASSWTGRNDKSNSDSVGLNSLSLPHILPPPSYHFALSFGCKKEAFQGVLVATLGYLDSSNFTNEVARTEIECTQSVRLWGDRWVRDFQSLVSLPKSLVDANVVLQLDVYGVTSIATESLKCQTSLGYFTIAAQDLVADCDDGAPLLLDLHPRDDMLFLIVEQVATPNHLIMENLYHFASHQYLVDATPPPSEALDPPSELCGKPSTRANGQVLVSEEMAATMSSLSVVVQFIKMLRQRNRNRLEAAKLAMEEIETRDVTRSSITSPMSDMTPPNGPTYAEPTRSSDVSTYSAFKSRFDECEEQEVRYIQAERRYAALLLMLHEGEEHGITSCLKRSTMKKDETMEFMPTNLVCHTLRASLGTSSDHGRERVWSVVTHGCSAAHLHGFKEGGLRKKHHEHRLDVVSCQLLSIVAASFLTTVHLAIDGHWENAATYKCQLAIAAYIGFLVDIESLLSTMGNERGMLEDMSEGVKWLNKYVILQVTSSSVSTHSECCGIYSEGESVIMEFNIPEDLFSGLPLQMQQQRRVKLTTVLFTQGINEIQSVANTVGDTSVQDDINRESLATLMDYIARYMEYISREEIVEIDGYLAALHGAIDNQSNKKQVNILIESSALCRRLGAGRTICCKSGKDRTAMSVTLEFSKLLVDQMGVKQGMHLCQTMRERGVRRTNVLVNTGKTMYAFNSIQLKCLPSCYQPPQHTANSNVTS